MKSALIIIHSVTLATVQITTRKIMESARKSLTTSAQVNHVKTQLTNVIKMSQILLKELVRILVSEQMKLPASWKKTKFVNIKMISSAVNVLYQ